MAVARLRDETDTESSCPSEGRFAIVTDAGWDAVDVEAPLTNGAIVRREREAVFAAV